MSLRARRNLVSRIAAAPAAPPAGVLPRRRRGVWRIAAALWLGLGLLAAGDAPSVLADGEEALRRGDLIGAVRAFQAVLAAEPGSWQARYGLGRALRASGDLESAERELRRAVESAPDAAVPARYLVEMLVALASPERRREGLAWVAEHAAGDADVELMVARAARRDGDFVTARAALDRARSLQPESKEAWVEEILLLRDALEYEGAEKLALAFVERHPSYYQTHVQLGRIYRLQGRLDEAEARYRRALELRPDEPTALTRLGEIRLERGDLEEARALLEQATVVRADSYAAYYLLGRLHLLRGDREAAEAALARFRAIKDGMRAAARLAGGAAMVDE
jgi:tetratricopeptide (TPR) repeat protein